MTWLVLGGGHSGVSAAVLLKVRGNDVLVLEQKKLSDVSKKKLNDFEVSYIESEKASFFKIGKNSYEGLLLSPGIPMTHSLVLEAREKKIPILSEIDLAVKNYDGTIIGVTGTNGKSTTVSMIEYLLRKKGINAKACGNIGLAPSALIASGDVPEALVLELSSYQLEQSSKIELDAAVILNLSEDHLQRHGTMLQYAKEKMKIFSKVKQGGFAYIEKYVLEYAKENNLNHTTENLIQFEKEKSLEQISEKETGILEWHNQLNAFVAIKLVSNLLKIPFKSLQPLIKNFKGLSHRFEFVGNINGKKVINDSKATNVAASEIALSNQKAATLLFLGGQGKGESFGALKKYNHIVKKVVFFGPEREKIKKELNLDCPVYSYATLQDALGSIQDLDLKKMPLEILFSPACASFDEFSNFEQRGDYFKEQISIYLD